MEVNDAWSKFLNGRWVKDEITEAGVYPIASSDETLITKKPSWSLMIVVDLNNGNGLFFPSGSWDGYHWSVPLPKLPSVDEGSFHGM
jgi:hypothetical protein